MATTLETVTPAWVDYSTTTPQLAILQVRRGEIGVFLTADTDETPDADFEGLILSDGQQLLLTELGDQFLWVRSVGARNSSDFVFLTWVAPPV